MIVRILTILFFFAVVAAIVFWLISGGWAATERAAGSLTNPIDLILYNGTSTGSFITLPWQPTSPTRGPDISALAAQGDEQVAAESQNAANAQTVQPPQTETFGNPSPYAGEVMLSGNGATAADPANQYVEIEASESNTSPIDIAGWSLQSAASGEQVYLPEAASIFVEGIVNTVDPVYLDPGGSAIITTGITPVGTSFRENMCTGYLEQLQTFTPELTNNCPNPSEALPETPGNLQTYGSTCFEYLNNLAQCYFPGNSLPSDLTPACQAFVENTMSYDGCVNSYQNSKSFASPVWRLYLNMSTDLWNSGHDVLRLLDNEGRVVDVLTY